MVILLGLLYIIAGALVTFALYYVYQKAERRCEDDSFTCVMVGIFWPVAAPFAFAIHFAKELNRRK